MIGEQQVSIVSYLMTDGIGRIEISRPERRNALNHAALGELAEATRRATEDDVRVLVLSGASDHFCSGADLKELEDLEFTRTLRGVLDDLAGLAFPTIAAVSGACMGLGMQLALSCDPRLATSDARFAVPVAKLGLMVDHWTVQRLAQLVGQSTARWMLLTADVVTASRAHEVGFVHQLVDVSEQAPGAAVLSEAEALAARVAALAPLALSGSKLGLDLLAARPEDQATTSSYRDAFERAWASEDLEEGRRAFAERRSPTFTGR